MSKKAFLITTMTVSSLYLVITSHAATVDYQAYQRQVAPVVKAMSLDEKLGQMVTVKLAFLLDSNDKIDLSTIDKYKLGVLYAGGGEVLDGKGGVESLTFDPSDYKMATYSRWQHFLAQLKEHSVKVTLPSKQLVVIKPLVGIDAVHGNYSVLGSTLFPQNISLSMTHDDSLLKSVAASIGQDIKQTGFNWVYAPTVALTHNPQWGRTMETWAVNLLR